MAIDQGIELGFLVLDQHGSVKLTEPATEEIGARREEHRLTHNPHRPTPEQQRAYHEARAKLEVAQQGFRRAAEEARRATIRTDREVARRFLPWRRTRALLVFLGVFILLPMSWPIWLAVAIAAGVSVLAYLCGETTAGAGELNGTKRARRARTHVSIVAIPTALNAVLIAALLPLEPAIISACSAVEASARASEVVRCVAAGPPNPSTCSSPLATVRLLEDVADLGEEIRARPRRVAWMALDEVEADLSAATIELVATSSGSSGPEATTEENPPIEVVLLEAVLAQSPIIWLGLAVTLIFVSKVPTWLLRWLVRRQPAVTYLSEAREEAALRAEDEARRRLAELERRWRAAFETDDGFGDALLGFIGRRIAFAAIGAALGGIGLALIPGLLDFLADAGDLFDAADGADALAAADIGADPSGFSAGGGGGAEIADLSDAIAEQGADPNLIDVNGDGVADMTSWGTEVHWTDSYVRADGTFVDGYYAAPRPTVTIRPGGHALSMF